MSAPVLFSTTPTEHRPCTCNAIHVGATASYTYADLGVLCPSCTVLDNEYGMQDWWESLSTSERIAERWNWAKTSIASIQTGSFGPRVPRPGKDARVLPPF